MQDTKRFRDRPKFAEVPTAIGIVGGVWGLWFSNALTDPGASWNCAEQQCGSCSAAALRTTGSCTAGAPIKGGLQGETSMTTISSAGTVSGAGAGFLDKERTVATAGFNRWLVPPAALCIHLCIGMAYGFSVFWLPLSSAIGITPPGACSGHVAGAELVTTTCDWKIAGLGWTHPVFRISRVGRLGLGRLARAARTAQGRLRLGDVLVRGLVPRRVRHLYPSAVAAVARLRCDRRHRPRPRLHLAGVDVDQVVSRQSRYGDRHGDHGIRRRRHDRRAAGQHADEVLPVAASVGVLETFLDAGRDLLRFHAGRRASAIALRRRLASRGLDSSDATTMRWSPRTTSPSTARSGRNSSG